MNEKDQVAEQLPISEAAKSVGAWVEKKVLDLQKNRRRSFTKEQIAKTTRAMEERVRTEQWDGTKPSELVALYGWLHRAVYGVDSAMTGRDWSFATMQAGRLIAKEFAGDAVEAVDFVRWTWQREQGREKWRQAHGKIDGTGIGWRLQFAPGYLLTDFRITKARLKGRGT
jgi:hypothetical protein